MSLPSEQASPMDDSYYSLQIAMLSQGHVAQNKVHYYLRLCNTDSLFLSPKLSMIPLNPADSLELTLKTAFKKTKASKQFIGFCGLQVIGETLFPTDAIPTGTRMQFLNFLISGSQRDVRMYSIVNWFLCMCVCD